MKYYQVVFQRDHLIGFYTVGGENKEKAQQMAIRLFEADLESREPIDIKIIETDENGIPVE